MHRVLKRGIALCLSSALLCSCSLAGLVPAENQDYRAAVPWQTSDTRGKHIGLLSNIDIRIQLEKGLMDLSKTYFSPTDHTYRTHMFLNYDELDATDGSRGLLGTLRDDNPNGLNPGSDEVFDTGNGTVTGPLLVADLYELDFYSGDALDGISIGLAVMDAVTQNGERIPIGNDQMKSFLQVTAAKINSYLKERFNDIPSGLPVLVAAYQLNTDEMQSSKGGYIYSEFFRGSQSEYHEVREDYLVVPSAAFSEKAPDCASTFLQYRSQLAAILPDTTYVTGQARFTNDTLSALTIQVSAYGKTAGEILAVMQSAQDGLSLFADTAVEYKVVFISNGEICALMQRAKGANDVEVIDAF